MTRIQIHEPVVERRRVTFSWTVTPSNELYDRTSFYLDFPDDVELERVPPGLWWRIALLCLHPHWPLLRPCRIELPVSLPPGEVETWLRLCEAGVATLEAVCEPPDLRRRISIDARGPESVLEPILITSPEAAVSCFSGGRDSLAQAALLRELGVRTTLVTTTSPVPWALDQSTTRRREVLAEMPRRTGFELVEVHTDFRQHWRPNAASERYGVGINEVTDTLLYVAAAAAVAAARGIPRVLIASEAEVQESYRRGGMVVQLHHYMYSAPTHAALSAVLAPAGLGVGSVTYALRQFQLQRLLATRYRDLQDLQYSCYRMSADEPACSRCDECRRLALNLVAEGVSPETVGIDLVEVLLSCAAWRPEPPGPPVSSGRVRAGVVLEELRALAAVPPARIEAFLNPDGRDRRTGEDDPRPEAMRIYARLHRDAVALRLDPEPGYREEYLGLIDPPLREGVREILRQHFAAQPVESYAHTLVNTTALARWLTAPLRHAHERRKSSGGGLPSSVPASDADWMRPLVPDPEPILEDSPDGRMVRVADTRLEGNELRYVTECVQTGWISSGGRFVGAFERKFATAMGCEHGVACASGASALQLALAGAGIGPGDEVIVPAFTMVATANAVMHLGAVPVLVDADPDTWNLDPHALVAKLSRRTRAIVPVHIYGQPADMAAIGAFAAANGLRVIEDAAEAHGASLAGRPVGSLGDAAAFSFYANKILTTGEGGMVTTNQQDVAALARELRDHAFSPERHFWHRRIGFNYRMSNLQAAVGLAQTEQLGELVARRRDNEQRYREALAAIPGLRLAPSLEGGVAWMLGVVVEDDFGVSRDGLRRRLAARGIETRTFFVPLHMQPVYASRFAGQRYPVAERLGATGLYLPSGPGLRAEDISYVAGVLAESGIAGARDGGNPNSV